LNQSCNSSGLFGSAEGTVHISGDTKKAPSLLLDARGSCAIKWLTPPPKV
jgi:hypothetical protein